MRSFRLLILTLLVTACASSQRATPPSQICPPSPGNPVPNDICPVLLEPVPGVIPSVPDDQDGDSVIRILAFGDFGSGSAKQAETARAMKEYSTGHPFDFGLILGDNFYPDGLAARDDCRWEEDWEKLYTRLGIRFYAVLGNHDYHQPDGPVAEMARSNDSTSWCLPASHYTFQAGPLQFFAIDTTAIDKPGRDSDGAMDKQKVWLEQALADSTATWKIVYGHHPVYSNGVHGWLEGGTLKNVRRYLDAPLTRPGLGFDVYLTGHDHDLQILQPQNGMHFLISGAAGDGATGFRRILRGRKCRVWDTAKQRGFLVLEADTKSGTLSATFVGTRTAAPYYEVLYGPMPITKGATSTAACARR